PSSLTIEAGLLRGKIEEKISELNNETTDFPGFARWHLEDTLVRAALLRSLRLQKASSHLEKQFTNLAHTLETQAVMRTLANSTKGQRGDAWVAAAVERASQWANFERENALARLCLLWFTGRQRLQDRMQFVVDQSCSWIQLNPNHTFVRWATIWLAGFCPY